MKILVVADIHGNLKNLNLLLEKIEKDFGNRFINVGIAEQNMIGIASGLALTGKKVFVYSIIPFLMDCKVMNLIKVQNFKIKMCTCVV